MTPFLERNFHFPSLLVCKEQPSRIALFPFVPWFQNQNFSCKTMKNRPIWETRIGLFILVCFFKTLTPFSLAKFYFVGGWGWAAEIEYSREFLETKEKGRGM